MMSMVLFYSILQVIDFSIHTCAFPTVTFKHVRKLNNMMMIMN